MSTQCWRIVPRTFHPASYLVLLSLSYLALGVTIPAMSLIVVSKGFSLAQLSIVMIVYSFSVMTFEIPSGIYADAKGKRNSFALGLSFSLFGSLLLFSSSFPFLCAGFACTGLGRAYASGSLDSLLIERGQQEGRRLEDLVFALDVNSGVSLSVGSLLGGLLLSLGPSGESLTSLVLLTRSVLLAAALGMLFLCIEKEAGMHKKKASFISQTKMLGRSLAGSSFLVVFGISVLLQGLLLSSLEGYWQPYLKELLESDSQLWILGLISATIFAISVLGSILGKRLLKHIQPTGLYCFVLGVTFCLQFILAGTNTILQFLILYSLIYLVLGVVSTVGLYLLNKGADDRVRASLFSVSSFCLQSGGLLGSLLATIVFLGGGISLYWTIASTLGFISLVILSFKLLQRTPFS